MSRWTPERLASSRSPVGIPLVLPTTSGSLISRALRSLCERADHQALTAWVSVPSRRSSAASASVSARPES